MCSKLAQNLACTIVIRLVNIFHWFNEEKLQNPWKGKNVDMGSKLLKKKDDKRKEKKK